MCNYFALAGNTNWTLDGLRGELSQLLQEMGTCGVENEEGKRRIKCREEE